MIRFAHLWFLYFLLLIPVFTLLFISMIRWKKRKMKQFGELSVIRQLMKGTSYGSLILKFILFNLAYIFLVFTIAQPQIGSKMEKLKRKGVDLIVLLDVSNSMMAQDIQPNRLERAKQSLSKLVDRLEDDRLGIIIFAGKAYTQLPITNDYAAAKMLLPNIQPYMVPEQGTAIGSAIEMALKTFEQENDKSGKNNKGIIIITDGENHEDDALAAARNASDKGILISTIGMGLPDGAPIPVYNESGIALGYKKDMQGNTIISKLDETGLQQIAALGKGIYVRASNTQVGLDKIFDNISKLDKKEYESILFSDYEDRFQYFLAFALVLFVTEVLISERRKKYMNKVKLFEKRF